jgi:cytochrome c nitrite reductase small subunit
MFKPSRAIITCILIGIPVGVAAATFRYGEGLSYFSNDPRACMNCHIMTEQYDSWSKSGHHHVAACNDCHLPHSLVPKLIAKSRNGWNHSYAFTMQNFHEPIRIGQKNREIVQESCLHCHQDFVHSVVVAQTTYTGPASAEKTVDCIHCHKGVGHAPTRPTGKMSWIGDTK